MEETPIKEACKVCHFVRLVIDPNDEDEKQHFCRRYPPTVSYVPQQVGKKMMMRLQSADAPVKPGGWCGEFKRGAEPVKPSALADTTE